MIVCTTCFCPPNSPKHIRGRDRGHVVQGCVGAAHVGYVFGESARWLNRPEAKKIRKALAHIAPTIDDRRS